MGEPFGHFRQGQGSPTTDGIHGFEDQQSSQEPYCDPGLYNGGEEWNQGIEEPYHTFAEPQALFTHTLETPTISLRSDEGEHAERSPSLSPIIEGNQMTAPVAAESLTVKINPNRARFRNRRKKKPYERRPEGEKKRKREIKTRNPETQEYIPVGHFRS